MHKDIRWHKKLLWVVFNNLLFFEETIKRSNCAEDEILKLMQMFFSYFVSVVICAGKHRNKNVKVYKQSLQNPVKDSWRKSPDSLKKTLHLWCCCVRSSFINSVKLDLWQILHHLCRLVNSALNAKREIVCFHVKRVSLFQPVCFSANI